MARELLLIRHGIAVQRGSTATDDERALTTEGRARTRQVLKRLMHLELGCDSLISSPLIRARQTAELALQLGLGDTLNVRDELAPGQDPLPLLQELLAEEWKRVAIFGHEPDLSQLASHLMGCSTNSLQLKKAGVALVELEPGLPQLEPGSGQLKLLLSPKVLLEGKK